MNFEQKLDKIFLEGCELDTLDEGMIGDFLDKVTGSTPPKPSSDVRTNLMKSHREVAGELLKHHSDIQKHTENLKNENLSASERYKTESASRRSLASYKDAYSRMKGVERRFSEHTGHDIAKSKSILRGSSSSFHKRELPVPS